MARTASGLQFLDKAKELLTKARTVQELRQAQAVVLPLEFRMSLEQTSSIIGVSKGWVCQLRTDYIRNSGKMEEKVSRGGRYRENLSITEESEFLLPFIDKAKTGGILVVTEIKDALEARLGRRIAL